MRAASARSALVDRRAFLRMAGAAWVATLGSRSAYALTRASKSWVRIVWLLAGLVVLVPWPFIMVGAVGTVAR